ncbi:MAG: InlB B-repeat-containing protein [Oscillospiraceae bacterium]|nr:InlB B-repeat-containing protein [Oscillospiraceae bacterium]
MKNIAKKRVKWLIAATLCLVGLLTVSALLLPYISPKNGSFSQILRLNGEGDESLGEEPPAGPVSEEDETEPVTLTLTLAEGIAPLSFTGLSGEAVDYADKLPTQDDILQAGGAHWRFDGWSDVLPVDFPDANTQIAAILTQVYSVVFTGIENPPEFQYLESGDDVVFPNIPTPAGCTSTWTLDGQDASAYSIAQSDLSFAAVLRTTFAVRLVGEALPGGNEVDFGDYIFPVTVGQTLSQAQILMLISDLPDTTGFTFVPGADFTIPANNGGIVTINYKRNKYALTFYGCNDTVFSQTEVPFGMELTIPAGEPTCIGYHFDKWMDFPEGTAMMGTEALSFYAKFDPNEDTAYTVLLVGEALPGGSPELLAAEVLTGTSDGTVTAAEALAQFVGDTEFEGFTFIGAADFTIAATGDGVYTINYSRNSYTLTLVEIGSDGEHASEQSVLFNLPLDFLPSSVTYRPFGQRFDAWDSHPSTMPANDDLKVTAQYVNDTYDVVFRNYNGVELETIPVEFGGVIPQTVAAAARLGYHFTHWATYQDDDTLSCEDDSHAVTFDSTSPVLADEGITYYAHFDPNTNTPFTLVFVGEKLEAGQFDYANPLGQKVMTGTTDLNTPFSTDWLANETAIPGYRYAGVDEAAQVIAADSSAIFHVRFTRLNYSLRLVQEGETDKGQAFSVRLGTPIASFLADFEALSKDSSNTMQYKYGYEFDCWLDSALSDYDAAGATLPAGGLTLYARYKAAPWTASFSYASRTEYKESVTNKSNDYTVDFNGQITPPTVRRYGYSFKGWKDDVTNVLYQPNELFMSEENRAFTAVWEANKYSATFIYENNSGTQTTVAQDLVFDSAFDLPVKDNPVTADTSTVWAQEEGRVKCGYELKNWLWEDDDSGEHTVEPTAKPTMDLEGGMTFTATQDIKKYPAIFTWVGGTQTIMVAYGTSIDDAVAAEDFVWYRAWNNDTQNNKADFDSAALQAKHKGYSIDGWEENRCDGAADLDPVFGIITDCTKKFNAVDHALKWKVSFRKYNDSVRDWVAATASGSDIFVTFGDDIPLPGTPSPTQYFKGWCTDTALKKIVASENDEYYQLNEENLTLYARFECPIEYRIAGQVVHTEYVAQFSPIVKWNPTAPAGYHFTGWTEATTGDLALTQMPARKITFLGDYDINVFTIQFKYKDKSGKWVETAAVDYASSQIIQLPGVVSSAPDTDSEKFTGWSIGTTSITPGTTKASGSHGQKITVTAQYRAKKLKSVTASLPSGVTFSQGSVIDLGAAGLIFYAEYDNSVKEQRTDIIALLKNKSVTYTPQTFAAAGPQDITITYKLGGESASCKLRVQITPRRPVSVAVTTLPAKTTYQVGEKLDLRGGMLEIRYDNGTRTNTTPLTLSSANEFITVSNFDSSAPAKRILTVRYSIGGQTFTTEFTVTIVKKANAWLKGDVNNDKKVNSLDLLLVKRHILGIASLSGEAFNAADIDGNGKVNSVDLMKMLRHILGIEALK